ncbi:MAG: hypothetical protein JSR46_07865, partial [Verrucomicrobia bacterium]|nr:hypothetical protein [Verrucomicrobiota bacterium]
MNKLPEISNEVPTELPPFFFVPKEDVAPVDTKDFLKKLDDACSQIDDISHKIKKLLASIFSFSAPTGEVKETHRQWQEESKKLAVSYKECTLIEQQLYKALPSIDPFYIPTAMKRIQCLFQKCASAHTPLTNLQTVLKSDIFTEALHLCKIKIKLCEEIIENKKNAVQKFQALRTHLHQSIDQIKKQTKRAQDLKNNFLFSHIYSLHVEILEFFTQTIRQVNTNENERQLQSDLLDQAAAMQEEINVPLPEEDQAEIDQTMVDDLGQEMSSFFTTIENISLE